jgi:nitroimidazol reductase NimA-like FMN-containing flavoprotein (pyridoxamine 5'-phosphate oxidase superfamily)
MNVRRVAMFRELAKKNKLISEDACIELLKKQKRGVLSVLGDEDYPYGMPLNHYYDEESGKIYFHSGKIGHKLDAISADDKVSFCVYDKGYHKDGHWSLNIKSVIIFGRIHIINDWSDALMVEFSKKFTSDVEYINEEIKKFRGNTALLCLEIENMTGKIVNEA